MHEWYADGLDADTRFLGASMSKSALAHLVGRAVRSGALALDDEVTVHVPELRGSGYAGVRVRDLLTMTSGVDWVEDHRDPDSLASRLLGCFFDGGDSRGLLSLVGAGVAPGTRYAYCTADSQVLDWVRERATGVTFADDLTDAVDRAGLLRPTPYVGVDGAGVALAGGAVAATARDWARIGMLRGRRGPSGPTRPRGRRTPSWRRAGCRARSPPTRASATTGGRSTPRAAGSSPTAAAASSPRSTARPAPWW